MDRIQLNQLWPVGGHLMYAHDWSVGDHTAPPTFSKEPTTACCSGVCFPPWESAHALACLINIVYTRDLELCSVWQSKENLFRRVVRAVTPTSHD